MPSDDSTEPSIADSSAFGPTVAPFVNLSFETSTTISESESLVPTAMDIYMEPTSVQPSRTVSSTESDTITPTDITSVATSTKLMSAIPVQATIVDISKKIAQADPTNRPFTSTDNRKNMSSGYALTHTKPAQAVPSERPTTSLYVRKGALLPDLPTELTTVGPTDSMDLIRPMDSRPAAAPY